MFLSTQRIYKLGMYSHLIIKIELKNETLGRKKIEGMGEFKNLISENVCLLVLLLFLSNEKKNMYQKFRVIFAFFKFKYCV